ncbi:hypothetical protein BI347_22165 [Chromobacterium sphagni]|uniref:HTH cro/C1-type domain-containing protein n=1 Tax=Chromobacterium sphagni TaxID=1903179 RepID=A0A1S1WU18_9NEIS|nr:LexA family transcriptional regulator [Chromobacterium sphagni]OHX10484.1 hypothetical protein BI347_22165 [Chromobacterium sphagni]
MINIGGRISTIRTAQGLSLREVCNRLGWEHTPRLSQYENNNREPTLAVLESIADVLGVSLQELLFGQENTTTATHIDESGTVHIELHRPTSSGIWQAYGKIITLNKDMLDSGTQINALRAMQIENDQMEPYLSKGDFALIDTRCHEIIDGAVYLIAFGNSCVIRRAYSMPADSLLLNPDNQRHPPMNTSTHAIQVLGRVIWRGG